MVLEGKADTLWHFVGLHLIMKERGSLCMKRYLQRLGRSLMLPVAVLPAAAILMGIGYWIDPTGWGSGNVLAAFLIKAGASIIDHIPILFAVGVAFGMGKKMVLLRLVVWWHF